MAKTNKRKALGRGLSVLLNNENNKINIGNIIEIDVNDISTNPNQPRSNFKNESINELSKSIKELGLIQPITVKELNNNKFQLISGERRLKAFRLIGLNTIPSYVRKANDIESLEMAIVENIQRKDLNAIEIGLSYQRLIDECQLTHEDLSKKVSKDRSTISNFLRLLKLPNEIQKAVRDNEISMGHARALLSLKSNTEMINAFLKIKSENLSVRSAEELLRRKISNKINKFENLSTYETRMQNDISFSYKSKVKIKKKSNGKGQIIFNFKNQDHLNEILDKFDQ